MTTPSQARINRAAFASVAAPSLAAARRPAPTPCPHCANTGYLDHAGFGLDRCGCFEGIRP
jgi:hypothetical protein